VRIYSAEVIKTEINIEAEIGGLGDFFKDLISKSPNPRLSSGILSAC
jgi:hypothetical protein